MVEEQLELKEKGGFITIDVANCIAGRICSRISKMLLQGRMVSVVNADKAMLSGSKFATITAYKKNLEVSSATNPIHGPFHPRRPDTILTRMVRGMLPKRKPSGKVALKKLRVYNGIPEKLKKTDIETFDDCKITKASSYYVTMGEIAKEIGWKGFPS
ncbi:MAG: 50S ribosomal protein L13 [Nitrososphaeraceae archaeon]